MLVHLRQYRRDDAGDAVKSDGEVSPDRDPERYFGKSDVGSDEWDRVDDADGSLLVRSVTLDGVSAVSAPEEESDEDDGPARDDVEELPGRTLQIRHDGEEEYVAHAEIVEIQDANP